jgi:hypothetical protein
LLAQILMAPPYPLEVSRPPAWSAQSLPQAAGALRAKRACQASRTGWGNLQNNSLPVIPTICASSATPASDGSRVSAFG